MQNPKRNKKVAYLLTPIALATLQVLAMTAYAEEANLAPVEVVATTPLAGIGVPKEQIAANVQTATGQQIEDSGALNIADYMNKNMTGVHVNDNQGNPFQVDLNYRGFTASPLLGTPQGISVYMDGVRMNQPFGDIVQWDLIPKSAIKNMTLIPGSNPLFGLNTLGGAISIQTKDGLSYQGAEVEAGVGSHGRYSTEFETGGKNDNGLNWYVNATRWAEDGWRDSSPSGITQLFSKLGWKNRDTDVKLTYALANSNLTGNGLQQKELLDSNYKSVFTKPDQTHNNANFLNLEGKHSINENTIFTANAYYRKTNTHTFNGDYNENSFGASVYETSTNRYQASLYNNAFPTGVRCSTNNEPNEKCTGLLTSTNTSQTNYGLSGQLNFLQDLKLLKNNFIVGGGVDIAAIKYTQSTRFAYLNSDRSFTPLSTGAAWTGHGNVSVMADGLQDSENSFDNRVDLTGKSKSWSMFFQNITSDKSDLFNLSTAARFNTNRINNYDNITPSGLYTYYYPNGGQITPIDPTVDPRTQHGGDYRNSLTGSHTYSRLNPSLGLSFRPSSSFNSYVSYSESNRAPTSIELGCADPDFGCRLPNSMAGDPHLKQVVAKTWELGARGRVSEYRMNWSAGLFNTNNYDDILFVANSGSTGYFKNFGQTRRRGAEFAVSGREGKLSYVVNYTYLDATYQSAEQILSPYNTSGDANGLINIDKGNKIPLMPSNLLKLRIGYALDSSFNVGLGVNMVSSSYARGNENNKQSPGVTEGLPRTGTTLTGANATVTGNTYGSGGVVSDGSGKVPGYAIFDLSARYRVDSQLSLNAQIANLFDTKYYTSGQLGPYAFNSSGGFTNGSCVASHDGACQSTMMYSPGAPRTFWVSMRYTFDKPRKD